MPNTTPYPELQALELIRRLRNITVANDYQFNIAQVERVNRDGSAFEYRHLSIRVDDAGQERVPELDCAGNPPAICWSQNFELKCFCRNSNSPEQPDYETDEAVAVNVSTLVAAVYQAITAEATDPSMWQTMGGNAFNTEFGPLENMDADDGEYHGKTVNVTCFYRVSENNPFELRA